MKTKEQLTVLSITQYIFVEWNELLEKIVDIARYSENQKYDVISTKYRVHEKLDNMTYKLLSRMSEENFSYKGKTKHTVLLIYPEAIPEAVANRIRLQCIVNTNAGTNIKWRLLANTESGIVTTIPDLTVGYFPDSKEEQESLLKEILIKEGE